MAGDCLEVSVRFVEHATSMTKLSSCWLSESQQTLSHHVLMRTNDLRGLPYTEAGRATLSRFGRTIALKFLESCFQVVELRLSYMITPNFITRIWAAEAISVMCRFEAFSI